MNQGDVAVIEVDGEGVDLSVFEKATRAHQRFALKESARERLEGSRAAVEDRLAGGAVIYGVNTGFGKLARVRIDDDDLETLQKALIRSHAAGVGDLLPPEVVRGMLLMRANTLARGHSGVRPLLVDRLLQMLNADILPEIPSRGSVGASGDLAPLAHLALAVMGEGRVQAGGVGMDAAAALDQAGLEPLSLASKEGLALINGTQAMTAVLAIAVLRSIRLTKLADLITAMTTDAVRGTDSAFDPRIHALRPHPGQMASAGNLYDLLQSSQIRASHLDDDERVQDPYCIRCAPQVHGAARDVLSDVIRKLEIEFNAVTDNPLVFADDGDVLSGGNFHGEPMAMAADSLSIAVAELGAISERRIEKLTNVTFSLLPPFLTENPGLNSGFMMAHVTAAALTSENKVLAHPASVDSVPTSADMEDHVSMGMHAALKSLDIVANVERILAIELLAASQGFEFLRPMRSTATLEAVYDLVRSRVPKWTEDRFMAPDIATALELIHGGLDDFCSDLN